MRQTTKTSKATLTAISLFLMTGISIGQSPSIASFQPSHGPAGTKVSIQGSNLGTTTAIYFNGVAAQVVSKGDWNATTVVPSSATTGKLKIVNAFGNYTCGTNFTVDGASSGGGTGDSTGGTTGGTSGGSSGGSTTGSSGGGTFINPPNITIPTGALTSHPRIFIRSQDVGIYQARATPNNSIWVSLNKLAETGKARMDGNQIQDNGGGYAGFTTPYESYAELFALMSLVHPNPDFRADYANRAYNLIMQVFTEAAKGMADGQPFRGHDFATSNRASWFGEGFPLTVDWIYNKFTASDKAKIRSVFLRWIQENLNANTSGADHPSPQGVYNDSSLVDTLTKIRTSTNNYYCNHAREVGLMAMALDETDDVPSVATDPPAGTLRKFVGNAVESWLYQVAKYESTDGAGGISPEGSGYGELDLRGLSFLLLAMNTTGLDQPNLFGPQAGLAKTSFWDQDVANGFMSMLSPSQVVQQSYIGPAFLPYQFSDSDTYQTVDYIRVFGPLAIQAYNQGDMVKYQKLRWMIDNLPPGGVNFRSYKIESAFNGSAAMVAIMYFLACDPSISALSDPRLQLPYDYFGSGLGIVSSRTSWDPSASWFITKSSWNAIDHQFGDANGFGFWRNGEWLTKPHAGYGFPYSCSDYQNTLCIQNPDPTNDSFWTVPSARGSQWPYDPTGDPTNRLHSFRSAYTFAESDATNLYNNSANGAKDVAHASTSMFFLKPDVVVRYDRADSKSTGRFKRVWLNTSGLAIVNGPSATATSPTGQKLVVDALLPKSVTLTASGSETTGVSAAMEPMTARVEIEDSSVPSSARYLTVLQGVDVNGTKIATAPIQSSSGTAYDGAVVGSTAVLFKKNMYDSFVSTTFSVPINVTVLRLTGLVPGAKYSVTISPSGTTKSVSIAIGGTLAADDGGVLSSQ